MDEFGKNLRFYRKQRRMTQTDLANRVGVAPAYVSQIESALRMPSLKVARKFAESLSVDLPILLGAPETTRSADHLTDAEKLEVLRSLIRSVEFDQDHRPERLELERYPGARALAVTETDLQAVRLYVFVEGEPGGVPRVRFSHPGRERVHCAAGRVRLLRGSEEDVLEAGETREFDATIPHVLTGDAGAVVVSTAAPRVTRESLIEDREGGPRDGDESEADGESQPASARRLGEVTA
jgi:transcriptional regulator with XRE-family HTH domain